MKNADEAGSKVFGFIDFRKHAENNIPDGGKQKIKSCTVLKEIDTKFLRDGKDTVSVDAGNINDDEIIRENRRNGYYVEAEGEDEFTFFFSGWWGYEDEFEILNGMRKMYAYSWGHYPHVQRMDGWEDFIVIETLAGNLPKYNDELYSMFPELRKYRGEEHAIRDFEDYYEYYDYFHE